MTTPEEVLNRLEGLHSDVVSEDVEQENLDDFADACTDYLPALLAVARAAMALGVIGNGYCFCSRNRDPDRYHHEPECRDLRAALAALAEVKP